MALAQNRLVANLWTKLRSKAGIRFTRFAGVAVASFSSTEVSLMVGDGVFRMTSTWAAVMSCLVGAAVSYVLSRWAWERKGKPDVVRETIPFWVISAVVLAIMTVANKFGYKSAIWLGFGTHSVKHTLWVGFVWGVANVITFITRFFIFHYVLFADRTTAARVAATGPDEVPGAPQAPQPGEAPYSAAPGASAEAAIELSPIRAPKDVSAEK